MQHDKIIGNNIQSKSVNLKIQNKIYQIWLRIIISLIFIFSQAVNITLAQAINTGLNSTYALASGNHLNHTNNIETNHLATNQSIDSLSYYTFNPHNEINSILQSITKNDFDLSSTLKSINDGILGHSVSLSLGGSSVNFTSNQFVTPAEAIAINQILNQNHDSLVLNNLGQAVGGSLYATNLSNNLSALNIPENVKFIDNVSNLNLNGNLINYGNIIIDANNTKSNNSIALDAHNLLNGSNALISSSGSFTLKNNDLINLGSIYAKENLTIESNNIYNNQIIESGQGNICISSNNQINISGTQSSQIEALNNFININDTSTSVNQGISLNNNNFLSKILNINAPSNSINGNIYNTSAVINETAQTSHLITSTNDLLLGNENIKGDPTYVNINGDISLNGTITTNGNNLAILASGNINVANNATASITTLGGNVIMIAGLGSNLLINSNTNSASIPTGATATTNYVYVSLGANSGYTGGNIDLITNNQLASGSNIIDTSNTAGNGGNITLVALANGSTGGEIFTANSTMFYNINASSSDIAPNISGGNILIIANASSPTANNTIDLGNITTNGGIGLSGSSYGTVGIYAQNPQIATLIFDTNGNISNGSSIVNSGSNTTNAGIMVDNITTQGQNSSQSNGINGQSGGNITLSAGGNITFANLTTMAGNGQSNSSLANGGNGGVSGNLTITTTTGNIIELVGSINTSGGSGGTGGGSTGTNNYSGGLGGNGGNVSINTNSGNISTNIINLNGGNGAASGQGNNGPAANGGSGGLSGNFSLSSNSGNIELTGAINAIGGNGGNAQCGVFATNGIPGYGGNGGIIYITDNTGNTVSTNSINSIGGNGGSTELNQGPLAGLGGNGNTINISANGGSLIVNGNVESLGGAGGSGNGTNGNGGTGGNANNILITSLNTINISGSVIASGAGGGGGGGSTSSGTNGGIGGLGGNAANITINTMDNSLLSKITITGTVLAASGGSGGAGSNNASGAGGGGGGSFGIGGLGGFGLFGNGANGSSQGIGGAGASGGGSNGLNIGTSSTENSGIINISSQFITISSIIGGGGAYSSDSINALGSNGSVVISTPATLSTLNYFTNADYSQSAPITTAPIANTTLSSSGDIVANSSTSQSVNINGSLFNTFFSGSYSFNLPIIITENGANFSINNTSNITPSEMVALVQIVTHGSQSIVLSGSGTGTGYASGGSFNINSNNVPVAGFTNLSLPAGVTLNVNTNNLNYTNLATINGNINFNSANTTVDFNSGLIVNSSGTITFNNSGTDLITATNAISITGNITDTSQANINLTSTSQSINTTAINTGSGTLTLDAGLTINNTGTLTASAINLVSGSDIGSLLGSLNINTSVLTVNALGNVIISDSNSTTVNLGNSTNGISAGANSSLEFFSNGSINIVNLISAGTESNSGNIFIQSNGTITQTGNVPVISSGSIGLYSSGYNIGSNSQNIYFNTSSLSLIATGSGSSSGNIYITDISTAPVNINNTSITIGSSNTFSLITPNTSINISGNLSIGLANGTGSIILESGLTSTNGITASNTTGIITSGNLSIFSSGANIGSNSFNILFNSNNFNISTLQGLANPANSGNIYLTDTASSGVIIGTSNSQIATGTNGSINFTAINSSITIDGNLTVGSSHGAGIITLASEINSGTGIISGAANYVLTANTVNLNTYGSNIGSNSQNINLDSTNFSVNTLNNGSKTGSAFITNNIYSNINLNASQVSIGNSSVFSLTANNSGINIIGNFNPGSGLATIDLTSNIVSSLGIFTINSGSIITGSNVNLTSPNALIGISSLTPLNLNAGNISVNSNNNSAYINDIAATTNVQASSLANTLVLTALGNVNINQNTQASIINISASGNSGITVGASLGNSLTSSVTLSTTNNGYITTVNNGVIIGNSLNLTANNGEIGFNGLGLITQASNITFNAGLSVGINNTSNNLNINTSSTNANLYIYQSGNLTASGLITAPVLGLYSFSGSQGIGSYKNIIQINAPDIAFESFSNGASVYVNDTYSGNTIMQQSVASLSTGAGGDGGVFKVNVSGSLSIYAQVNNNGVEAPGIISGQIIAIEANDSNNGYGIYNDANINSSNFIFLTSAQNGYIAQAASNALMSAPNIALVTGGGAIGAGARLLVNSSTLAATTSSSNGFVNIYDESTTSSIFGGQSGTGFSFTTNGNLNINGSIATGANTVAAGGDITLTANGIINVGNASTGINLTTNNGNITIQNNDTNNGIIDIAKNDVIFAKSPTSNSGEVVINIGTFNQSNTVNPSPSLISINPSSGGNVYFGNNSINALAGGNILTAQGQNIVFNTGSLPASAISLSGNDKITADPPALINNSQNVNINNNSVITSNPVNLINLNNNILVNSQFDNYLNNFSNFKTNFNLLEYSLSKIKDYNSSQYISSNKLEFILPVSLNYQRHESCHYDNFHDVITDSLLFAHDNVKYNILIQDKSNQNSSKDIIQKNISLTLTKGAIIYIIACGDTISFYNLHDTSSNSCLIKLPFNKAITLNIASHISITLNKTIKDFSDINLLDKIGYRNLNMLSNSQFNIFKSEFSIPSAIVGIKPLHKFFKDNSKEHKALIKNILKTASIIQQSKSYCGNYMRYNEMNNLKAMQ